MKGVCLYETLELWHHRMYERRVFPETPPCDKRGRETTIGLISRWSRDCKDRAGRLDDMRVGNNQVNISRFKVETLL